MSAPATKNLFASYSHKDGPAVHGLVRLLRVTGAPIFLDIDSIPAGTKWRQIIEQAISRADAVVLFWSTHAAQSEQVQQEWRVAISFGKDIIPVCLEHTPLPPDLSEYQAVLLQDLLPRVRELVTPADALPLEQFVRRLLRAGVPKTHDE